MTNHISDDEYGPGLCAMVNKLLPASQDYGYQVINYREYYDNDQLIEQPPQNSNYSKTPGPWVRKPRTEEAYYLPLISATPPLLQGL